MTMDEAISITHGSQVDLITVVAFAPVTPKCSVWLVQSIRYSPLSLNVSCPVNIFHSQRDSGILIKWFLIEALKCTFNKSALNTREDIPLDVEHGY